MKWIFAFLVLLLPSLSLANTVELTASNTLVLQDMIDIPHDDMEMAAIAAKYSALRKGQLLYVFIFSPGGSIDAAKILSSFLNILPDVRLVCVDCASAAGWIFESSNKPRLIMQRSQILMHEERLIAVTPKTLRSINIPQFCKEADEFNKIFVTRLHMSPEAYVAKIEEDDWTVTGAAMLRLNLADQLIKVQCDSTVRLMMPNTCANTGQ